jgi:hypothetical protein
VKGKKILEFCMAYFSVRGLLFFDYLCQSGEMLSAINFVLTRIERMDGASVSLFSCQHTIYDLHANLY